MRIRLHCLSCGHAMDLSEAYEDYAGEIRCWACRAMLEIELREGRLKSMRRAGAEVQPEAG